MSDIIRTSEDVLSCLDEMYEEAEQVILDYIKHGANYNTTIKLLTEIGFTTQEAAELVLRASV